MVLSPFEGRVSAMSLNVLHVLGAGHYLLGADQHCLHDQYSLGARHSHARGGVAAAVGAGEWPPTV
jgi:hypothetical protein